MTDLQPYRTGPPASSGGPGSANLADILERVLDKGIVIAGDIQINLLDIELLTIKLRLLVASVDKAREMGIDWWENDAALSSQARKKLETENDELRARLERLEAGVALGKGSDDDDGSAPRGCGGAHPRSAGGGARSREGAAARAI